MNVPLLLGHIMLALTPEFRTVLVIWVPLCRPEVERQRGVTHGLEWRLPQARDLIGMDIINSLHVIISHSGKAGDIAAKIIYLAKHCLKDRHPCINPGPCTRFICHKHIHVTIIGCRKTPTRLGKHPPRFINVFPLP